jgi:hypothetical protein
MPTGVEQAEGRLSNYLASFGRRFIVEGRGGVHLYQLRYRLYRNRRWLSGSLPFRWVLLAHHKEGCSFPVFRAPDVITAVLLGLMLWHVIPCCLESSS